MSDDDDNRSRYELTEYTETERHTMCSRHGCTICRPHDDDNYCDNMSSSSADLYPSSRATLDPSDFPVDGVISTHYAELAYPRYVAEEEENWEWKRGGKTKSPVLKSRGISSRPTTSTSANTAALDRFLNISLTELSPEEEAGLDQIAQEIANFLLAQPTAMSRGPRNIKGSECKKVQITRSQFKSPSASLTKESTSKQSRRPAPLSSAASDRSGTHDGVCTPAGTSVDGDSSVFDGVLTPTTSASVPTWDSSDYDGISTPTGTSMYDGDEEGDDVPQAKEGASKSDSDLASECTASLSELYYGSKVELILQIAFEVTTQCRD